MNQQLPTCGKRLNSGKYCQNPVIGRFIERDADGGEHRICSDHAMTAFASPRNKTVRMLDLCTECGTYCGNKCDL